jgi:hypothetical protein
MRRTYQRPCHPIEHRKTDGARYSIFVANQSDNPPSFSYLVDEALRDRAKKLASANVTVLELAATAHWLKQVEKIEDWRTEIVRRKGSKTADGRLEEALALLQELKLPPSVVKA